MPSSETRLETWNRKLHSYVGLYLLVFVWLFAVSGLIINHPKWPMQNWWPARKQERFEKPLRPVGGTTRLERARDVLAQLGIAGEIGWNGPAAPPGRLVFRAGRPGTSYEIDADLAGGVARVAKTTVNGWGALHIMHTFSGVHAGEPEDTRDWAMTRVWSFSMDAVAVGLAFMVLSSWWIWFRAGRKRLWGALALAAGLALCVALLRM